MSTVVRCPQGHLLRVSDRHAGQSIRCPKCQSAIAVPPQVPSGTARPSTVPSAAPRPGPASLPAPAVDAALAEAAPGPVSVAIGYRPDASWRRTTGVLAAGLALLAGFQALPAFGQLPLGGAPDWARLALLLALLQVAFAVYLLTLPDWSTLWVAMLCCAGVATAYAVALGAIVVTPRGAPVLFELQDVRHTARLWCSAVILLTLSAAYTLGRISVRWHARCQLLPAPHR